MCTPDLSTTWQYNIKDNRSKEFYSNVNRYKLVEISKKQLELLKKRVLTEHLRFLIFSGGEVLLSEHNYKIMQYLLEMSFYNMEVHITTNGTTKIKDAWLESANKFKQFNLEVSIDGAGSVYNYIRAGGDWNTLIDVIKYTKQVAPKINWMFNYVAQALNAHSIKNDKEQIMELFPDIGEFNEYVSVCHTDPEDSYAVIHPEFRKKYGIEHWADTFEYDPTIFAKFMRKQSWLDNMHGTNLEELNPDFFNENVYPKQAIDEYRRIRN
jgi:sulfatase maturation enzyme AslB (radical SAM superfamily)